MTRRAADGWAGSREGATREQLAAEGLQPGGQPALGWSGTRRGRVATFARAGSVPTRPATLTELAQRAA